jgi:hypothetical protein
LEKASDLVSRPDGLAAAASADLVTDIDFQDAEMSVRPDLLCTILCGSTITRRAERGRGMSKIALAVLLGIAPFAVGAQTVYKCTKADGSVMFSQNPCGKDAKIVMDDRSSPKNTSASDNGDAKSPASQPTTDPNVQAISDSVDDSNCRRDAQRLATVPSTERINQAQAELGRLESIGVVDSAGNVNSYSQSVGQSDVQQIADLKEFISAEQASINAQAADSQKRVDEALAACDRKKTEREARVRK